MKGSENRRAGIRKGKETKISNVRRAILFVNRKKKQALNLEEKIKKEFSSLNIKADTFKEKPSFNTEPGYDIAVSLGGDGTVLSAARTVSPLGVSVFPVNFGTFGFIAGVQPGEWLRVFNLWLAGKAPISRRLMLEIIVERDDGEVLRGCCLNDVVIASTGIAKIINLSVYYTDPGGSGGGRPGFMKLGAYRSDGLIVSTPTGSTAYSAAAGGPIVDPELEALILNPICPFTLSNRSIVLPADETVLVEVGNEQRSGVLLTVDGQVTEKLKSGDRIYLKKAPYHCLLVASGRGGFYHSLQTKLGWTGGGNND